MDWGTDQVVVLVFALGGQHFFNKMPAGRIETDVKLSLTGIIGSKVVHYFAPLFDQATTGGKYPPPTVAFLRCEDRATRDTILEEPFIAVNDCVAYWPTRLATTPSEAKRSWTLAYFEMSATTDTNEMTGQIRSAVRERMHTDKEIVRFLDRMTQAMTGSLHKRIDFIALTIDAVYKHDENKSIMVVYMDSAYGTEDEQLTLRGMLRAENYIVSAIRYTAVVDMYDGSIKTCVICKLDDHPSRMCPFTAAKWWGPPDQFSGLPPNHPLKIAAKTQHRNQPLRGGPSRGGGRGGGRGGRGGRFRGRGGR
ncbi:unnamed protein product [Mycena citricolor]|uniref:Uncharacterized protein n=1 Tax=Mycena citricolor TaxID=2018698 RepID=A0AAD2HPC8_9AGAR|nr:unnamed protein product [Mycena citricolor]